MHYPLLLIILRLIVAGNQGRHLERKHTRHERERKHWNSKKYMRQQHKRPVLVMNLLFSEHTRAKCIFLLGTRWGSGSKTVPDLSMPTVQESRRRDIHKRCCLKHKVQRGQERYADSQDGEFISSRGNLGRLPDIGGLNQEGLLETVAFILREERKRAIRDQHRPVSKQTLPFKVFTSKICKMDIICTLLNLTFPNTACFLTFQPFLRLCLLPAMFSFPPTSTLKNVISYAFFTSQLKCIFF